MQNVTLKVDGKRVTVRSGAPLIDAAREAGVEIPSLCFLPGLPPRGVCRVCSVSVSGRRGLVPGCATPVAEGLEVETNSPTVQQTRRVLFELAIAEHGPCDDKACGGEQKCQLMQLARKYGVTEKRFDEIEPPSRAELSADSIQVRPDGCILCDRCIQACRDLHVIGRSGRGEGTHIVFDADRTMGDSNCIACGDCVAVCPVNVFQ